MMLKIGVTGNIGSGKSVICKVFKMLSIAVFNADEQAKYLIENNAEIKQQIITYFGNESYINNHYNKPFIAKQIFENKEQRNTLNNIVHPVVINHFNNWILQQTTPYIIKEAALLFEANSVKGLDYVIGVKCPIHLRLQRIKQRDNITEEAIQARIKTQMNEDEKMKLCNWVIENNEQQLVLPQVLQLHKTILDKISF